MHTSHDVLWHLVGRMRSSRGRVPVVRHLHRLAVPGTYLTCRDNHYRGALEDFICRLAAATRSESVGSTAHDMEAVGRQVDTMIHDRVDDPSRPTSVGRNGLVGT